MPMALSLPLLYVGLPLFFCVMMLLGHSVPVSQPIPARSRFGRLSLIRNDAIYELAATAAVGFVPLLIELFSVCSSFRFHALTTGQGLMRPYVFTAAQQQPVGSIPVTISV